MTKITIRHDIKDTKASVNCIYLHAMGSTSQQQSITWMTCSQYKTSLFRHACFFYTRQLDTTVKSHIANADAA